MNKNTKCCCKTIRSIAHLNIVKITFTSGDNAATAEFPSRPPLPAAIWYNTQ